jgi:hypothetical protein
MICWWRRADQGDGDEGSERGAAVWLKQRLELPVLADKKEKRKRGGGGGPGAGLGSDRSGWPGGRASTPTIGVRPIVEGDWARGRARIRAASLLGGRIAARGPCETDDVTRAEFRSLGGLAGWGEGRER